MKPIYYITFYGYYEKADGTLSKRISSFSTKDTCIDFKPGDTVCHKRRFFHIAKVEYERIEV